MIPGPTEVSEKVLKSLCTPPISHYGDKWIEIYNDCIEKLAKLFGTNGLVIILPGPASLGMEFCITNVLQSDFKILCISNGFFGNRFREVTEHKGAKVLNLSFKWGEPIDISAVEMLLNENPNINSIIVVHNETSTGVLNPIKELGKLAHKYDCLLIVDAVSSLGAIEFNMDNWHIDAAFTGPQKCIGALPGITPMAFSKRFIDYVYSRKEPIRSWYLNLKVWMWYIENWGSWHPHPTTQPAHLILALREALNEIFEEGLEKRFKRHYIAGKAMRESSKALGLRPLIDNEKFASPTVTVINIPENVKAREVIQLLRDHYNILVSGGLGPLKGKVIRIGHMALTASEYYISNFVKALGEILNKMGYTCDIELAIKKVNSLFEISHDN